MSFRQAVVLAAGRGLRMGALTERRPKGLCEIAGRTILQWTLDALRANGIDEILLIGGWQHRMLNGFADELRCNAAWSRTNMVRSLQIAGDWLCRESTLVAYGDCAYAPRVIAAAIDGFDEDVVVPIDRLWHDLWSRRFSDVLSDAESLAIVERRIVDIGRRPSRLDEIQGQYMGLLLLTPEGWRRASATIDTLERRNGTAAVDRIDVTSLLRRMVEADEPVYAAPVDGGWIEIDSPNDLRVATELLSHPDCHHDFRR